MANETDNEAMSIVNAGTLAESDADTGTQDTNVDTAGADAGRGTSSPADGNTGESQPPSDGQQPDAPSKATDSTTSPKSVKLTDELQAAAREALGLQDETPDTVDYWRGRHSESSKEAKEFKRQSGLLNQRLEEMGLKVVVGDKAAEIVATDKWKPNGDAPDAKSIVEGLTDAEKDLAVDDPDKYAAMLINKAIKATARPAPTKNADEIEISDAERQVARTELAQVKDKKGEAAFPDFDMLDPWIDSMANDPSTPDEFKKFMNSSPDNHKFAMGLLHNRAAYRLVPILAKAADASTQSDNKKKAATEDVSLSSEGTTSSRSRQTSSEDDEAKEIVAADQNW